MRSEIYFLCLVKVAEVITVNLMLHNFIDLLQQPTFEKVWTRPRKTVSTVRGWNFKLAGPPLPQLLKNDHYRSFSNNFNRIIRRIMSQSNEKPENIAQIFRFQNWWNDTRRIVRSREYHMFAFLQLSYEEDFLIRIVETLIAVTKQISC